MVPRIAAIIKEKGFAQAEVEEHVEMSSENFGGGLKVMISN
jgi:hypothetical protein